MAFAYLINQYPGISHTFIRREIEALERRGHLVVRFAIRSSEHGLIAEEDHLEAARTRRIVGASPVALAVAIAQSLISRPIGALKAFVDSLRIGFQSDVGPARHFLYYGEALALATWMRRAKVTHIHAHFGTNSATVAMLAACVNEDGFSMTVHGPEEFDRAHKIALTEKIRRAKFVAAVSSFGRSQLRRLVEPKEWNKIVVVPCSVDKAFYFGEPSPLTDSGRFLVVARLSEQKGIKTLIEAAEKLKLAKRKFSLTIIGDGELRGEIERQIDDSDLTAEIALVGWKTPKEVRKAIENAAVFILPSYAEGLPVSIMEAMSVGRPVISTFVAGIPELVISKENGWLVPASDAGALASAMMEAIDLPLSDLTAMGRAGRARVLAKHDSDLAAAILANAFALFVSGTPR
ncbi:MAG: glycosyltransferase [Parvularculaceae bacterium]|nr:glycosyltransferase [Parvularculaceae bacterium]